MIIDSHMHSSFSNDSEAKPEAMIERALLFGFRYVCFTDHLELDYPQDPDLFHLDLDLYFSTLETLREKYRTKIDVLIGVEMGLQPHLSADFTAIQKKYPFDFCIGSNHVVNRIDPYYPDFFENRSETDAYREYFECILENLKIYQDFDVLGHLDYVVRYGPNRNRFYSYEQHREIIDAILHFLIQHDKGIELNTSGLKYGLGHPSPHEDIIERYAALGGSIITVGSDAHAPEHFAYEFTKAKNILKRCGFSHYTYFKGRKAEFVKL